MAVADFRILQVISVLAGGPWEAALRVRLGRRVVMLGPGFHLRIPFLDRTFVRSVRLRTISDSGQTVVTQDGDTACGCRRWRLFR